MHAVIREASYSPDLHLEQTSEFANFQTAHAARTGYQGTIVANIGGGRFITVTLWDTPEDMAAAREELGPVVQRVLNPIMAAPSKLYGTGEVVFTDLTP